MDYIINFTRKVFSFSYLSTILFNQNWTSISCSKDGKICSVVCRSDDTNFAGGILVSSDYGNTFQLKLRLDVHWNKISMSSDGKYQIAVASYHIPSNKKGKIMMSSNFGENWYNIEFNNFIRNVEYLYWNTCDISNNGRRIIIADNIMNKFYSSDNYGLTWRLSTTNQIYRISEISMNKDDYMFYIGFTNSIIAQSNLYGYIWKIYSNNSYSLNFNFYPIIKISSYTMSSDSNDNNYGTCIAISNKFIFICNNFTNTCSIINSITLDNNEYFISIYSSSNVTLILTSKGKIYSSQDLYNWSLFFSSTLLANSKDITFSDNLQHIYICKQNGNVYKIIK